MKGTVFSGWVLNHRSQLTPGIRRSPSHRINPAQTPVVVDKPRNTHLANGGAILLLRAGETKKRRHAGGGSPATPRVRCWRRRVEPLSGRLRATTTSACRKAAYRPVITSNAATGSRPPEISAISWRSVDLAEIVIEINGVEQDRWSIADLVRPVPELDRRHQRLHHPAAGRCGADRQRTSG